MSIQEWLEGLGLAEYGPSFRENAIDLEVLVDLDAEDLRELGVIAVGHRKRLLKAIAELRGIASHAPSADTPATSVEVADVPGERRNVAVLFADLSGYTSMTEERGAEAAHAALEHFFSAADRIIEHAGGRVDKHIGDCVMGVFGAPRAHGDDCARAVRAALEIRAAMPEVSAQAGWHLAVHTGLAVGLVVASPLGDRERKEYVVTGSTVNLAARLADQAGPGEILLSDAVHSDLADRITCESLGALRVKGLAEPVAAWRLLSISEGADRRHRFVGRQNEVRHFTSTLAACLEEGVGQVVFLRGEAGIGKTRITEEFERLARGQGFLCHRALVLDFGMESGRDAVRVLVQEMLELEHRASAERRAEVVAATIESGIVPASAEVHLHDLVGLQPPDRLRVVYDAMDNETRRDGRLAALAALVRHYAGQRPRLVIVEDLHWARPPLLQALARIANVAATCPAVLVATSRVDGDPLDGRWRAAAGPVPLVTIDLGPLRPAEALDLCKSAVSADAARIERCVERAAGNPLFLEQLLRHAEDDAFEEVPGSIQSLVQARLDRLHPQDRMALQAAAVIGQRIDLPLLRFLIDSGVYEPTQLVEKGLLRPQGQELLFAHALVREAVRTSLLEARRVALHKQAATWFQDRDLTLHAEHLLQAADPAAAAAFARAATLALSKYHYDTAQSLIEKGLAGATELEDRVSLLLLKGDVLHDATRMSEAGEAFAAALDAAPTDAPRRAALIGLSAVKRVTEDIDGALADLAQAEALAGGEEAHADRARIGILRGNLLFPKGDFEGCLAAHKAGLAAAELAERPDLRAAALGGIGDAHYVAGRMASARQYLEECVALARTQGIGRIEVANAAQICHTLVFTDRQDLALEAARAAIAHAKEVGHTRAEINARAAVMKSSLNLGLWEEAMEAAEQNSRMISRLMAPRFHQVSAMALGRALTELGRREEAVEVLRAGIASAEQSGFSFHGPSLCSALALAVSAEAEKRTLLRSAHDGIVAGCVGHNEYRVYAEGIDVGADLRDAALIRWCAEKLAAFPGSERVAAACFHARRGRLLADIAEGREPVAEIEAVLAAADRLGYRAAALHLRAACQAMA